jgi:hypothetical protein
MLYTIFGAGAGTSIFVVGIDEAKVEETVTCG